MARVSLKKLSDCKETVTLKSLVKLASVQSKPCCMGKAYEYLQSISQHQLGINVLFELYDRVCALSSNSHLCLIAATVHIPVEILDSLDRTDQLHIDVAIKNCVSKGL